MDTVPPEQAPHHFRDVVATARHWWARSVVGTVNQAEVINGRREECDLSARYLFMLTMSAGIAILGLLLSSPAVVIGAMLLSPLMGPIIGLGFALATGDFAWMKQATRSLVVGTLISVAFCALIVLFSPLQTVTPEIASRTRPNLFDLGVALFSALAGAYAMIRGREGTIVGVAIATALMPPLAVVGFGLATFNWTVFSGSLLLFFTNLMTIALTAAIMARLYGFRTSLSPHQTRLQTTLIVAAFVALAVPLGMALRQIAWEANATRQINAAVLDAFDKRARLSQIEPELHADPIQISATVLTPQLRPGAEQVITRTLERNLGRPVRIALTQYQVGTSALAAEQAQLNRAREKEQADLAHADTLADRLALIAGVGPDDVLVDRERRTATVAAHPLDGASLAAYRELESRILAGEPEWTIRLRPPARPLPSVAFADGKPTDEGTEALDLIAWAGQRVPVPIILSGPADDVDFVATALQKQGVAVRKKPGGGGAVIAAWGTADA
uniref:DUF389 domain-containing protein n=1 Tax=Altererythrobacter segetis TaxID=1104773 RepID=UPI00140938F5|nr:DUF389 domain-containing protein [Altererythrobacter segetis]